MCGILGILYTSCDRVNLRRLESMTDLLHHRGPDDRGFLLVNTWTAKTLQARESRELESFSEENHPNLGMGHNRLSILDLSIAGRQPMGNEDGLVWIVYNGEVYNYIEIRKELETLGHDLKSQTDTEVVLHAYEEWGTDCLGHFNGMWSFAIVDLRMNRVFVLETGLALNLSTISMMGNDSALLPKSRGCSQSIIFQSNRMNRLLPITFFRRS